MEPYLLGLNEPQRKAAQATEGPVIVLAGAGSGKTKMLITRVAHLIKQGVDPSTILAVTFTNKAAAEMKKRVETILREIHAGRQHHQWAQPWMGFSHVLPEVSTFHSFCVKLLRNELSALGFTRPFVIYDDDDVYSLIKKVLEEFDINTKNANPKRFKGLIDQMKCQAIGPEEVDPADFFGPIGEQLIKVYRRYQEVLRSSQALDFGDLIVEAYKLLRDNPAILAKYQEHFKYLMVDEYQDTNRAQYLLVNILAKKYKNICVVGDEDQSIYKWRGADIKNILDFQKDYPEALMVKLEQNYRSTQTIISAASAVIKNNKSRYDKTLWTDNEPGDKIRWAQLPDERSEAEHVARELTSWLRENPGRSFADIAIFYRSHAQSRALEEIFRRQRVAYKIVGGVGFYERREIKDALAYLRVLVNPDDSVSLLRIINVPARGIGKTTLDKVEQFATKYKLSFYAGMKKMLGGSEEAGSLPPSAQKKLIEFMKLLDGFRALAQRSYVGEMFHHILDATGYVNELKAEDTDEAKARIQNLEEFDTVIQFFEEDAKRRGMKPEEGMLQGFLNQVTLEASLLDKGAEEPSTGSVSMMTLHSSKGLEFPLVFLVGCEEGIFPSKMAMSEEDFDSEAIEEERRLCYVGITRAMERLVMTSANMRRIYGQIQVSPPSRFLLEIPEQFIQRDVKKGDASVASQFNVRTVWESERSRGFPSWKGKGKTEGEGGRKYDYGHEAAAPTYEVKAAADAEGTEIKVGQKVKHASYGAGTVKQLEGSESDRKVTIEFSGRVTKKFSLKHVQLELQ
ncbi:MAG: ATP-dependent helicase [Bacteriovoracia bacterium]